MFKNMNCGPQTDLNFFSATFFWVTWPKMSLPVKMAVIFSTEASC